MGWSDAPRDHRGCVPVSSNTFDIRRPSTDEDEEPMGPTGAGRGFGPGDGLLVVNGLTERFGGLTAVEDLSFAVDPGEVLGFIGPTGAGKSTTFSCIAGISPPTSGTVYFKGEDVTGRSPSQMTRRGLAWTFQGCKPLWDRTVLEIVRLSLDPNRPIGILGHTGDSSRLAKHVCERVGLGDHLTARPEELTQPALVRLELGRALATDPDLLVADEPFAGLPADETQALCTLFADLRDHGLAIVVGETDIDSVADLIDRAILLTAGSKVAEGTPAELGADRTPRGTAPGREDR